MSVCRTQKGADLTLLDRAIANKDLKNESTREVFEEMRLSLIEGRREFLSEKQRRWVKDTLDEPEYENLVSAGKVPRGREVPTPPVLLRRPLKPPGR